MGWRDLLEDKGETIVAPWLYGRSLHLSKRSFKLRGRLPAEPGWYRFRVDGRHAEFETSIDPHHEVLVHRVTGHLVGDRLVEDDANVDPDPRTIASRSERVHLIDAGLDRFVRVTAGRSHEKGPLIFVEEEMPLGPEEEVLSAYLDDAKNLDHVRGVPPALDAAFRMDCWRRAEAVKRRLALEAEARRAEIAKNLGDGAGRRRIAVQDFETAARAALAVGGATYLEHRPSAARGEMVVRFRIDGRRFECSCEARTMQIVDAGVCLTDHETNERGDSYFTLESLPGVIRQAEDEGALVVFRHID